MTNKGDNEKRVQCPYDPSHQILHYRFQTHLVKCKRNFMEKNPNAKMAECMYNAVHQVPEPELAYHHDHCIDRIRLDRYVYVPESVDINKYPVPELNLQSEENWDNEVVPVYNPEEHCVNNPILRNKCTLSAAKRRDFRFEERQRMQKLHSEKQKTEEEPEVPRELQQPQVFTQPRRPMSLSAGLKVDTRDVTALLEQVKLGPQTVTVPKLAAPGGVKLINSNDTENNANIPNDNGTPEYPPLGRGAIPGGVKLINSNKPENNANILNGNETTEYPPLGRGAIPKRKPSENPPQQSWAAIATARGSGMCGIASTSDGKPTAPGKGRGSSLAQHKK